MKTPTAIEVGATTRTRQLTAVDVDAVTELILASSPDDPQWDFCHKHKAKFPEDHVSGMRVEWLVRLRNPELEVYALEKRLSGSSSGEWQEDDETGLVALVVWDHSHQPGSEKDQRAKAKQQQQQQRQKQPRRDMSPTRVAAWDAACAQGMAALRRTLDPRWVHLSVLVVHPDYQGRERACSLVLPGLVRARKLGVPVGVLAGINSRPLCVSMGFRLLSGEEGFRFQAEGGEGSQMWPMAWGGRGGKNECS